MQGKHSFCCTNTLTPESVLNYSHQQVITQREELEFHGKNFLNLNIYNFCEWFLKNCPALYSMIPDWWHSIYKTLALISIYWRFLEHMGLTAKDFFFLVVRTMVVSQSMITANQTRQIELTLLSKVAHNKNEWRCQ